MGSYRFRNKNATAGRGFDLGGYQTGERIQMPEVSRKLRLSDDKTQMEPVILKTYIDTNGI